MEFESIKKIVEAEQEAEQIKKQAMQDAEKLLQQAENSKEKSTSYFKAQLYSKQKELEKEQTEEITGKISKIKADATEKVQRIKETSQEKISEAVERIFSKVIKL